MPFKACNAPRNFLKISQMPGGKSAAIPPG
jgi:hypothetical protein